MIFKQKGNSFEYHLNAKKLFKRKKTNCLVESFTIYTYFSKKLAKLFELFITDLQLSDSLNIIYLDKAYYTKPITTATF